MELHERRELLRNCPYFQHLDDDLIDKLSRAVNTHTYLPGARIFTEGREDGSAALHIVGSGTARVFKLSAEGREQVLRLFQRGDTFADVAAFDGGPYPANADALEPTVVLRVPRHVLLELMREHPEIAISALQIMAGRLRHMTSLVEDLSLRRVMSRIARLLLTNPSSEQLTQTQMAAMVGTAREMVNRSLHTLADRGIIELRGGAVVVLDAEQLRQVADVP
jgi:CRP/FNR family transcriptional regulator